jgi:hypothetical protein
MKAYELRIGNYLFVPGIDREVIVSAIFKSHYVCEDSDGIRFDESVRINYQPISLTEEWLLKFGFERRQIKDLISYASHKFELYQYASNNNKIFFEYADGEVELEYVHQIQNLYF